MGFLVSKKQTTTSTSFTLAGLGSTAQSKLFVISQILSTKFFVIAES